MMVKSPGRGQRPSYIRGIIGYVLMNNTKQSLTELAIYSNKSQSTISRSVKKIAIKITHDRKLKATIDAIIARLE